MAARLPLVLNAGQLQQLQSGDTLAGVTATLPALDYSSHLVSANFSVPAGCSAYVSRYVEIAAGITLEVGADADLEIG